MSWKHRELSEKELKELVSDVYDGKIFTSLHCGNNVMTSFMMLLFLGAAPSKPSEDTETDDLRIRQKHNRESKIRYIEECLKYEEETEEREAYLNDIGMLYEYMDKAGPRYVNGMPTFFSGHILSKNDAKRFVDTYNKYVEMRKKFEEEWKV